MFAALEPEKFLKAFMHWTQSLREAVSEEMVAIDGNALRRAIEKLRRWSLNLLKADKLLAKRSSRLGEKMPAGTSPASFTFSASI